MILFEWRSLELIAETDFRFPLPGTSRIIMGGQAC